MSSPSYAELAATTNFSFLKGASHPEEMTAAALELGHCGLGIADRNSLAGVVRAFSYLNKKRTNKDEKIKEKSTSLTKKD
jgi:error-prone DNA polymerase